MKILKYIFGVLLFLIIAFFALGLFTKSVSYETSIEVDKPADESWMVMGDESKLADWLQGFQKSELLSGTRGEVGAVSNIYMDDRGSEMMIKETIKQSIPNELMAMNFVNDFMDMDYEMRLSEENGKTKISTKTVSRGDGIFARSMMVLMKGAMTQQEDTNLAALKKVIEANTKDYFPERSIEFVKQVEIVE